MATGERPAVSRRLALQAALKIVDEGGLGALSLRAIGESLNVRGMSLYHYFDSKDEILIGVAELAVEPVWEPFADGDSWRRWLPEHARRLRSALIAHPAVIPVILRRMPVGVANGMTEAMVARLEAEKVNPRWIAVLIESLELLAVTSALQEVEPEMVPNDDRFSYMTSTLSDVTSEELFDVLCGSVISAVDNELDRLHGRSPVVVKHELTA